MFGKHNRIAIITFVFCVIFSFGSFSSVCYATASSEEETLKYNKDVPEVVQQYKTGVVKLCLYVTDNGNNKYNIRQGSGFLLGDSNANSQDTQVILTDNRFVEIDKETAQIIQRQYGFSTSDELMLGIDIVLDMNTRIPAEIEKQGDGYAILVAQSMIRNVQTLKLGDAESLNVRDPLYVLSYGGESEIIGSTEVSDLDLEIHSCQVAEIKDTELKTNYEISSGEIGAPIMDQNGYVVGILAKNQDNVLMINSINNIRKMLDVLDIKYESGDIGSDYNKVTKEIDNELSSLLLECQELAVQKDKYTKKSIKKLKSAINTAISVQKSSGATYDDYQSCIDELNKYKKKLRSINHPYRVVQFTIGMLILLFSYLCVANKRQIQLLLGENRESTVMSPTKKASVKKKDFRAKIIRCDTGQQILINTEVFKIGQSIENIDYTITDNTSISRHHANIEKIDGALYIVDQNSTNYTYVNGIKVAPGQYSMIQNGDVIQLSNIQFKVEIL